jgi:hypothetical protein
MASRQHGINWLIVIVAQVRGLRGCGAGGGPKLLVHRAYVHRSSCLGDAPRPHPAKHSANRWRGSENKGPKPGGTSDDPRGARNASLSQMLHHGTR